MDACDRCTRPYCHGCEHQYQESTKGEMMAALYFKEDYARGGFVEDLVLQLLADINMLRGK